MGYKASSEVAGIWASHQPPRVPIERSCRPEAEREEANDRLAERARSRGDQPSSAFSGYVCKAPELG
jgi:hypothetical protein